METQENLNEKIRQVNKPDKNEIEDRQGMTLIEIPSRYVSILHAVISFLKSRESSFNQQDYLELCVKIQNLIDTQVKWRNRQVRKELNSEVLYPLAVYQRFYLTRKDVEILLDYHFVVDVNLLMVTLNEIGVTTIRGLKLYGGIVYPWKILSTQVWKDRDKELMKTFWGWTSRQNAEKKQIKENIAHKIYSGGFSQHLEEIKQRILANHL